MNHLGLDEKQSLFLHAIGNESRLRILMALKQDSQQTIYRLCHTTGLDRKVIRKHLPQLTEASLVTVNQQRRVIHHGLNGDVIRTRTVYGLNHAFPLMKSICALFEEVRFNER